MCGPVIIISAKIEVRKPSSLKKMLGLWLRHFLLPVSMEISRGLNDSLCYSVCVHRAGDCLKGVFPSSFAQYICLGQFAKRWC